MELRMRDLLFSSIGMLATLFHFVFLVGAVTISWAIWYCWHYGIITPVK